MFESIQEDEAGRGVVAAWLLQQTIILVGPALVALIITMMVDRLRTTLSWPAGANLKTASTALIWSIGAFAAFLASRACPRSTATGRWVWPLPVIVATAVFIQDAVTLPTGSAAAHFLGIGGGENSWVLVFITYPTCMAVEYSVAMAFQRHRRETGKNLH